MKWEPESRSGSFAKRQQRYRIPRQLLPALLSTLAPASFYLVRPWTSTTYIRVGNSRAITCPVYIDMGRLDSPRFVHRFLK